MLRISKFLNLTLEEKKIFLLALYLLVSCRVSLSQKNIRTILGELEQSQGKVDKKSTSKISIKQIVRLLNAASRCVPFLTCLSKAMAGHLLFVKFGHRTKLRIGVAKDSEAELAAHAWLVLDDEVVFCNLPDIQRYKEIPLERITKFR